MINSTNKYNLVNPLFDPQIEIECKKYLKNNINKNELKENIVKIQFEMDKFFDLKKEHALQDNVHVFNNLTSSLDDVELTKCNAKFFTNKFLLIFKYYFDSKNNNFQNQLNNDEKLFLLFWDRKIKDFLDFDLHYFEFIYLELDNFINDNVNQLENYIIFDNNLYYLILKNLCNSLYDKEQLDYKEEYLCSITNEIMDEPVKIENTYINYNTLKKCLLDNGTCPYTRKKLEIEKCEIDQEMKTKIENSKKNCRYITKCCHQEINKTEFEKYFFKNCYKKDNENNKYILNYEIKCYACQCNYFYNCV
jgi:hypothetical protein